MGSVRIIDKMVRTMEIGVETAKANNRRPTIVGYIRDAADRKLWYACTPSMTLGRITRAQAIHIMATQTMAGYAGRQTVADYRS